MPYKDPEKQKEWRKKHFIDNKGKYYQWHKEYRDRRYATRVKLKSGPRIKDCPLHGATTALKGSARRCFVCDIHRNDEKLNRYYAKLLLLPSITKCSTCGREIVNNDLYKRKYCSRKCQGVALRKHESPEKAHRVYREKYRLKVKDTKEYKDKHRNYRRTRRARLAGAEGSFTVEEEKILYFKQKGRCAVCRCRVGDKYERDHIVPLALGGSNYIRNIQLVCTPCNSSKGAKHPIEFMQSMGFLI